MPIFPRPRTVRNPRKRGRLFGGMSTPPMFPEGEAEAEADINYGLERPRRSKGKWWEKALDIAAPAAISFSEGRGIVPGMGLGYLANRARKGKQQQAAQEGFEKERAYRQKADIEGKKFDLDKLYKLGMLEVGRTRAAKPRKKSDFERYVEARRKIQAALDRGEVPDPADDAYVDAYKARHVM